VQSAVKAALLDHLHRSPPGKILDFPAGTAWLRDALGPQGWEYHAADLFTRPKVSNFRTANLNERFPYGQREFDYVACLEGIEHAENYHHVLRECHRVLRPGGTLLLSTPNPLNVKSRRRYYYRGTFNGFPHLFHMPAEGEHLHVSPINLSMLIAFAGKYGFEFDKLHRLPIRPTMLRFAPQALVVRLYTYLKYRLKPHRQRQWMQRLASWRVLLCDGMLLSFRKPAAECETARRSAPGPADRAATLDAA